MNPKKILNSKGLLKTREPIPKIRIVLCHHIAARRNRDVYLNRENAFL